MINTRDQRIDIVRGLAIVIIIINHLSQAIRYYGLKGREIPTPTAYGYSSAAELFVIVSGYMIGLTRVSKPDAIHKVIKRAGELYIYNWVLLLGITPFVYGISEKDAIFWRTSTLADDPFGAIIEFGLNIYAPRLLDVLQLYIILLLVTPIAIVIWRKSPVMLLIVSAAVYFIGHANKVLAIWQAVEVFHFNPLTWQLLFFGSLILGARRAHTRLFSFFERPGGRYYTASLTVIAIVCGLAKQYQLHVLVPYYWTLTDRDALGLFRVAHSILIVAVYAGLLVAARPIINTKPFTLLATIGRQSLKCFCLGVVITYAFTFLWIGAGRSYLAYLLLVTLAVAVTCAAAVFWDRRKTAALGHAGVTS